MIYIGIGIIVFTVLALVVWAILESIPRIFDSDEDEGDDFFSFR